MKVEELAVFVAEHAGIKFDLEKEFTEERCDAVIVDMLQHSDKVDDAEDFLCKFNFWSLIEFLLRAKNVHGLNAVPNIEIPLKSSDSKRVKLGVIIHLQAKLEEAFFKMRGQSVWTEPSKAV